jgi:hypothetical protein
MAKTEKFEFTIDKVNEEATLRVGEETFQLEFDFNALSSFYSVFKVNPAVEPLGSDPARWAGLLWVGLLHHQPDFKSDTVRSWFNSRSCLKLCEGTLRAFRLASPEPEAEEKSLDPPSA